MTTLGIDIGGSSVKAVLLDGQRRVGVAQSSGYSSPTPETIRACVDQVRTQLGDGAASAAHTGVCLPGIVADGVVEQAVNLPALVGRSVADVVGIENVRVFGDALAAGYGYWAHESDTPRAPGRLAALVLGTGVGFIVLDDGRPLIVDGGASGHLGQIDVSLDAAAPVGPDGGRGGLEGYIGAAALRKQSPDAPHRALLEPGEPRAAVVRAIRIVLALYRPHEVVLLGGVGSRLSDGLHQIRERVTDHLTSVAREDWRLRSGGSDHVSATGAGLLAS